jgi:hypothetical protein
MNDSLQRSALLSHKYTKKHFMHFNTKKKTLVQFTNFFLTKIIYYLFSSLMWHVVANLIYYLKNKEYLYQELTGEHEIHLEKWRQKNTINYLIEKKFISPLMLFVSLNLAHGNMYLIQHYVIKFVSDLWHISGYLSVLHKYQIDTSSYLWTFNSNVKLYRCTRYNIMWQSLSVTCDGSVVFLRVLRFPPPIKLTATI